jgi:GT2 family glycosyltransferase
MEEEARRTEELLRNSGLAYHYAAGKNVGFAGAHNTLFRMHDAEYVALLNPDATLDPQYLERIVAFLDQHPACASVTGLVYRDDPTMIDTAGLDYRALGNVRDLFGERKTADIAPASLQSGEVFGVSGALPVYRRAAVLSVSPDDLLYDPSFFMYKEDVELAIRFRRKGFTAWRVSEAVAYHRRGIKETGKGMIARAKEEKRRPMRLRTASYENQWKIYFYHFTWKRDMRDLWRTIWVEKKRSAALFFLGSPVVYFKAWGRIFRGLPAALKRRKAISVILSKTKNLSPSEGDPSLRSG